jgi:translation initiation factor 4G
MIQRGQSVPHNEKQFKERKKILADDVDSKFKHEILGVLNKLTPERFDKLTMQLCSITISSSSMLNILVEMIFNNATNEPKFANLYACMCSCLDAHNDELWCTLLYNKTSIIFDQDSGKYFWARDLQINELSVIGPYYSVDDGINDITCNIDQPLTLSSENLIIHYILVIDNILIKVLKSTIEEEYFINYSSFNNISDEDRSGDLFTDKKDAEDDAFRFNSFKRRMILFCQNSYQCAIDNVSINIYLYL